MWTAVIVSGIGCYLLKIAGMSVPPKILQNPLVERVADLLPVALLSALIAVQVFASGHELVVDARLVGLGVAVGALLLRAPFLVVVIAAAGAAALTRLWFGG
ncbi:AzlD domain-containing protein [Nocardioides caldifontis]|uniref:AzlD domain-containing protein n=1 Tax=Nocardioides caldifontis TaxID=2588938 RepID=UPI0011E039BA|nr:AzlD domain-containing protein [Nocardioides caldifontis]